MNGDFYTTKLTVELEVDTQFGPADAVSMIKTLFENIPAIGRSKVIDLHTNYKPFTEQDCNKVVMGKNNLPIEIKK